MNRAELDALDVSFTRSLLTEAHKLMKQHFPAVNLKSDAWTYHFHGDNWEFHGPDKFYWYGSASNAYEARYHGWMGYLKAKGVNVDDEPEEMKASYQNVKVGDKFRLTKGGPVFLRVRGGYRAWAVAGASQREPSPSGLTPVFLVVEP